MYPHTKARFNIDVFSKLTQEECLDILHCFDVYQHRKFKNEIIEYFGFNPYSLESIRSLPNKSSGKNLIYFLFYKNEIVYIGQTTNGMSRINDHIKENKKVFDEIHVANYKKRLGLLNIVSNNVSSIKKEKREHYLDIYEVPLIVIHKPFYNTSACDRVGQYVNKLSKIENYISKSKDIFFPYTNILVDLEDCERIGAIPEFGIFRGNPYYCTHAILELIVYVDHLVYPRPDEDKLVPDDYWRF